MKRLMLAVSLTLALVGGGCDDDGDSKPTDAKTDAIVTDGGTDGTTPTGKCMGTFAALTRAQLGAASSPAGKCAMSKDLDNICNNNLADKSRSCGLTCLSTGLEPAAVPGCVSACIATQAELTTPCAECYRDLFSCTLAKCSVCTSDPAAAACVTCQQAQGCLPTFFQCSGLPGGSLGTDAGADTGADRPPETGGDTGADVPAEAGPADAGADAADAADATAG
jgi:hypothetical protein